MPLLKPNLNENQRIPSNMKSSSEHEGLLEQDNESTEILCNERGALFQPHSLVRSRLVLLALLASISINVLFLIQDVRLSAALQHLDDTVKTKFAGLHFNTIVQDEHHGRYNNASDEILTNKFWDELSYDEGSIALDHEYARSMGLPRAQSFPWDDTKGIYFINGYHGLHCLKIMRRSMLALHDGRPLDYPWEHNMHCFNAIRQDIMCAADDTPRYTNYDHAGEIGVGQPRLCKSWDRLAAWATENTACWRDINPTDDIDTLLRFRYCPPGSPYLERIHGIFGDFEMGRNASAWT